jgi:hypothetical protein
LEQTYYFARPARISGPVCFMMGIFDISGHFGAVWGGLAFAGLLFVF